LSDNTYAVAAGIIQFPVEEKDTTAGGLREAVIKTFTSQKLIKITLWDNEFSELDIEKGDTLFVDGKYEVSLGQGKDGSEREYIQITAKEVGVVKGFEKPARTETTSGAARSASDAPKF
jgi:hypothetical protein